MKVRTCFLVVVVFTVLAACGGPEPTPTPTPVPEPWTRQFGSAEGDKATSVAVDGEGNAYLAGETYGALPGQKSAGEGNDAFLRKYDPTGVELWTRQFGSALPDVAYAVAVDREGNAYVAGETYGALPDQESAGIGTPFSASMTLREGSSGPASSAPLRLLGLRVWPWTGRGTST